MFLQPLGRAGLQELYPLELQQPAAIDRITQTDTGIAWLIEFDPLYMAPKSVPMRMCAGSLGALGVAGLSDFYDVPDFQPDPAPIERFISTASGKNTASSDLPPSVRVDNRLRIASLRISREIPQVAERLGGFVHDVLAEVHLDGTDGELDYLFTDRILRDRRFVLKMAPTTRRADGIEEAPTLASFTTIFTGRILNATIDVDGEVTLQVVDGFNRLDQPIQQNIYYGTGGADGSANLEGQPKPLNYGTVTAAEPTLVDPLNGIFQIHDGEFLGIVVKDRGVPLLAGRDVETYAALAAMSVEGEGDFYDIPLGAYATCRAQGYFRLAGFSGPITCDVQGDGLYDGPILWRNGITFKHGIGWRSPGERTHRRYAGGMLYRIMTTRAGFASDEIDLDDMLHFDALYPYEQGISIPSSQRPSVRDICTLIVDGVGAIIVRNAGKVVLRALEEPGAASFVQINERNLTRRLERVALPWGAPWSTIQATYAANERPLKDNEISAELEQDAIDLLKRENRLTSVTHQPYTVTLPDRPPLLLNTRLRNLADVQLVLARLLAFYVPAWSLYRIGADGIAFRADLLSTVDVDLNRFNLANHRTLLVIATDERPAEIETELLVMDPGGPSSPSSSGTTPPPIEPAPAVSLTWAGESLTWSGAEVTWGV